MWRKLNFRLKFLQHAINCVQKKSTAIPYHFILSVLSLSLSVTRHNRHINSAVITVYVYILFIYEKWWWNKIKSETNESEKKHNKSKPITIIFDVLFLVCKQIINLKPCVMTFHGTHAHTHNKKQRTFLLNFIIYYSFKRFIETQNHSKYFISVFNTKYSILFIDMRSNSSIDFLILGCCFLLLLLLESRIKSNYRGFCLVKITTQPHFLINSFVELTKSL